MNYAHKKHLFFDMDDTVTASRTEMDDDMYELLATLPHNIVIASGATSERIQAQLRGLPIYVLGQNGNFAQSPDGELLWEERLSSESVQAIKEHIAQLQKLYAGDVQDVHDLVEHRGAQISYSLIGHNRDLKDKRLCDPDQMVRKALLAKVPLAHSDVEVKIGGTTCFDYFMKGRNKGYNVARLIERMGWDKDYCVYFGDSLFEGGNDASVVGVIDTIPVKNHRHTYDLLREAFQ